MKRPRHQRIRPLFADTFERGHAETIAAMDNGGCDIPRQAPRRPLALRRVGVKRRAIPVRIKDPLGGRGTVELSCAVEASVELGSARRGIHVSRIGDVLARLSAKRHASLAEFAAKLAEALCLNHQSDRASVAVEGTLSYEEEISGVKEKLSLEHLDLFAHAVATKGRIVCSSGIAFNHITACPCVQETYRHSFFEDDSLGKIKLPLFTHTQRCQTRLTLVDVVPRPPLSVLLDAIDSVVVRSQNTLPREFELLNVYRAHVQPQFLEDTLRDLLYALYQVIGPNALEAGIRIESSSFESIHDFDLHGEIEFSVQELNRIFTPAVTKTNGAQHPGFVREVKKRAGKIPVTRP